MGVLGIVCLYIKELFVGEHGLATAPSVMLWHGSHFELKCMEGYLKHLSILCLVSKLIIFTVSKTKLHIYGTA